MTKGVMIITKNELIPFIPFYELNSDTTLTIKIFSSQEDLFIKTT